jgi:hypothetical protein
MFTRVNNTTWLVRSHMSDLDAGALGTPLVKLCLNLSFTNFITHPEHCLPICTNQVVRSLQLKVLPILDNINIGTWQRGHESCGVQIPGMDATSGRRGTDTAMGSSKGKGNVAPFVGSGDEVLSDDAIPL